MKFTITPDDVKGLSLTIGTPMYGGQCTVEYSLSVASLARELTKLGIPFAHQVTADSCVARSRNDIANVFLRDPFTHLLWIDGDIGFAPHYAIHLLKLCQGDKRIVGAPYPKKRIQWDLVKQAVEAGFRPDEIEKVSSDLVFNILDNEGGWSDEPVPVSEIGFGFLMIHRSVFEEMSVACPSYLPDDYDNPVDKPITAFFADGVRGSRFLTEDYWFNRTANELGIKTWLCPWMELTHQGPHIFQSTVNMRCELNQRLAGGERHWSTLPGWFAGAGIVDSEIRRVNGHAIWVELGAWKGRGSTYIAKEIKKSGKKVDFYSVDWWEGSPESDVVMSDPDVINGTLYQTYLKNIAPLAEYITPIKSKSAAAARAFPNDSVDFIYVDASHTYEGVTEDLNAWWRKLKPGGTMAGDDWEWPGVCSAVRDYFWKKGVHLNIRSTDELGRPQWKVTKDADAPTPAQL